MLFFDCMELFIFIGIIFCSRVVLVFTFNNRGGYNFVNKKANSSKFGSVLQWCLVPILSLLKVWNYGWAKKSLPVKEEKSHGHLFKTGQNFGVGKTLVWLAYLWRTATATFFSKKKD